MKIGELAALTGVSIRSLRYYEQKGLLTPIRNENGYREYTPFAEEQVRTIQLYLSLGLTTNQIVSFLHCVLNSKESFCKEVLPIYRQKLGDIDVQITQLQNIKSNLEDRIQSILDEQQNHMNSFSKLNIEESDGDSTPPDSEPTYRGGGLNPIK